ncbi:MAG: class I SAM-dependent methyltransferase [Acidimicrobiales bacterium]
MVANQDGVWSDSMPDAYERNLSIPVFQPFAIDLARRVAERRPARVLELAAGTGVLTRELLAFLPGVELVATDLNDAMVDVGRRLAPVADWGQADAVMLPFRDAGFDAVVCQFGVMFFSDRTRAFAEVRRVLIPGGAFAGNVWGPIEDHDYQAAVLDGLAQAFPDDPPRFLASVPHADADPGRLLADLRAGGFADVQVETVTLETTAPSARDLAVGYCAGTPVRAEIDQRGGGLAPAVDAVVTAIEDRLGLNGGPGTGRMAAHFFVAVG